MSKRIEESNARYCVVPYNRKALLKTLAVLFLNQLFDIFHSAHNIHFIFFENISTPIGIYLNTIDI